MRVKHLVWIILMLTHARSGMDVYERAERGDSSLLLLAQWTGLPLNYTYMPFIPPRSAALIPSYTPLNHIERIGDPPPPLLKLV